MTTMTRKGVRLMTRVMAALLLAVAAGACGTTDDSADAGPAPAIDSATPTIDAAPPDAFPSICGLPGDVGNELGVGFFCNTSADCSGTPSARFCATLGDPLAHFCTTTCSVGNPTACGTGATCVCDGPLCGCTPDVCL